MLCYVQYRDTAEFLGVYSGSEEEEVIRKQLSQLCQDLGVKWRMRDHFVTLFAA